MTPNNRGVYRCKLDSGDASFGAGQYQPRLRRVVLAILLLLATSIVVPLAVAMVWNVGRML